MSEPCQHVGATVHIAGGKRGLIVVCSDLLDLALVAEVDEAGVETGKHGMLRPSALTPKAPAHDVTESDLPY